MSTARSVLAAVVVGSMLAMGCTSTKAVVEPSVEPPRPPVVDQASIQAMGPPPGYVKPEIYWVRERIVLTSEQEPPPPSPQKSTAKKGKKSKKTGT
jgi:hypothetical protein